MVRVVLETNFLVDLLRGKSNGRAAARELEEEGSEVYTTAVTCYELLFGARRFGKRRETEALLADLGSLALTREAADGASKLQHQLASEGKRLDHRDALVLGTALAHGIDRIVSNDDGLRRVPEIRVRAY